MKHKEIIPALAQCWPADATCATVGTIPDPRGNEKWTVDTCRYCRFRALPPANVTDPNQQWWYGTGDGKHSPFRYPRLRRFLANGGDAVKFANDAKPIGSALRMKRDYADQHKPAQKWRVGALAISGDGQCEPTGPDTASSNSHVEPSSDAPASAAAHLDGTFVAHNQPLQAFVGTFAGAHSLYSAGISDAHTRTVAAPHPDGLAIDDRLTSRRANFDSRR